jgi:hypothetical protein
MEEANSSTDNVGGLSKKVRKPKIVSLLIIIGFIPGFLGMPFGLSLIDIRTRYGWEGLPDVVNELDIVDERILVDRAREAAWYLDVRTAVLELSSIGLPFLNSSTEILELADEFETDYLLADDYTLAHWETLDYLLYESILPEDSLLLNVTQLINSYMNNRTGLTESITAFGDTQPNELGRFSRIYRFTQTEFEKNQTLNLIDGGWSVSGGALLTSTADGLNVTLDSNNQSTVVSRSSGFALDLQASTGFILIQVDDASAAIARIQIEDNSTLLMQTTTPIGNGLYFVPIGNISIDDILIEIGGNQGDTVIIRDISFWQGV